jgi:hypothetical protein
VERREWERWTDLDKGNESIDSALTAELVVGILPSALDELLYGLVHSIRRTRSVASTRRAFAVTRCRVGHFEVRSLEGDFIGKGS